MTVNSLVCQNAPKPTDLGVKLKKPVT